MDCQCYYMCKGHESPYGRGHPVRSRRAACGALGTSCASALQVFAPAPSFRVLQIKKSTWPNGPCAC